MMVGDNFRFDIAGVSGQPQLEQALAIAFLDTPNGKVAHWQECGLDIPTTRPCLMLAWGEAGENWTPLPAPQGPVGTLGLVEAWLAQADYGEEPDHDGSNRRGARIHNRGSAFSGWSHAVCAIEPYWVELGK